MSIKTMHLPSFASNVHVIIINSHETVGELASSLVTYSL